MQAYNRILELHPECRMRQGELERATDAALSVAPPRRQGLITIPVVVHVLYNTEAENISDEQVKSQIAVLNRDFRAKNEDRTATPEVWAGLVSDVNLKFALATLDPNGEKTNGITRTETARTEFPADDSVKAASTGGHDAWPTNKYLNFWVCTLGDRLLGYAQFPGGPAETDGVVVLNRAFGDTGTATAPFNLGRTAVHEVGHWLNLRHIWGDTENCSGTDFVADTPNAQHPNYGKPKFPHISCNNGPSGDMFVNYMDYVDDAAMVMFTAGQAARMRAALDAARSEIGT